MNWYQDYFLPLVVDLACGSRAVAGLRRTVVPLARGRVLEVGFGSGLNLSHYDREKVEVIYGLEPSEGMRRKTAERIARSDLAVQVLNSQAEEIPLADESVDTVLLTFTLCTISDWRAGLREMRRVLRPDGRLIFCEHGQAPDRSVRAWQDRINPYWRCAAGGCNLNRPIPDMLKEVGFSIESLQSAYVPGFPKLLAFAYSGTALKS